MAMKDRALGQGIYDDQVLLTCFPCDTYSAVNALATRPGIWPTGDGRWCVVGELSWEIGRPYSGLWITIPDGFVTDLASIPRWLHWLINPFDPATAPAAIIHDWLLTANFEQRMAAGEFYRRLAYDRFPVWKRRLFFLAVLFASTEPETP